MNILVVNPPDTLLPANFGHIVNNVLNRDHDHDLEHNNDHSSDSEGVEIIVSVSNSKNNEINEKKIQHKNYKHLIVRQLRAELKRRGLATGGRKADMISRLEEDDETNV